jgi:hypothetical protein
VRVGEGAGAGAAMAIRNEDPDAWQEEYRFDGRFDGA